MISEAALTEVKHAVDSLGKIQFLEGKLIALPIVLGDATDNEAYALIVNAWNLLDGMLHRLEFLEEERRRFLAVLSDADGGINQVLHNMHTHIASLMDGNDWWQAQLRKSVGN